MNVTKKAEKIAKVEDASDSDDGSIHSANGSVTVMNRNEKKARKTLIKMGYKPVTDITRVCIKRVKNMLFVISKPEVYKLASNDSYIIFGEVKVEDASQTASVVAQPNLQVPTQENDEDEEEVDETGVEPKDIEVVMQQANVGRSKAVKALKKNDLDIVNAIMVMTPHSLFTKPVLICGV